MLDPTQAKRGVDLGWSIEGIVVDRLIDNQIAVFEPGQQAGGKIVLRESGVGILSGIGRRTGDQSRQRICWAEGSGQAEAGVCADAKIVYVAHRADVAIRVFYRCHVAQHVEPGVGTSGIGRIDLTGDFRRVASRGEPGVVARGVTGNRGEV